jgi:hypothetical protein
MPGIVARPPCMRALFCLVGLIAATALYADDGAPATSRFKDPDDGWFDISNFLDTAYGFVPLIAPITEPAVGYGATGALVFIDRAAPGERPGYSRPNITASGAGFRYLLARKHGLQMGLDVAAGPDKPIIYLVFGNAWIRP